MTALVRDQLGRVLGRRPGAGRRRVGLGRLQRLRQGRGVAPVGGVDLRRDDRPGLQIDRVLGLVGGRSGPRTPIDRAAILRRGDPRLGIGRRGPVRMGRPLAPALAVEPDPILGRGCLAIPLPAASRWSISR